MTMAAGIDGLVGVGVLASDRCCPPDICEITPESVSCNFINLLPHGPLWDLAKQAGISCGGWCDDLCADEEDDCTSMVRYASYVGRVMHNLIIGPLWSSIRESDPFTAFDTMDEWLDRLGWADCYNSACRDPSLGKITPYEIMGDCGPQYCPPTFSEDFTRIYKRGIIIALTRLNLEPVRNIAALNFMLEALYAELVPDPDVVPGEVPCLILQPTGDYGKKIVPYPCPRTPQQIAESNRDVQLYLTPGNGVCEGAPPKVYPMVLAAHCIIRSLLPTCPIVCVKRNP